MAVKMYLPALGEAQQGRIISWYKQVGERVEADEPLIELEMDHSVYALGASHTGILTAQRAQVGQLIKTREFFAEIEPEQG